MTDLSDASPNLESLTQRLRLLIRQMFRAGTGADRVSIEKQITAVVAEIASTPAHGLTDCILKTRALGDLGELQNKIDGKILPCATQLAESLVCDLHALPGRHGHVEG